MHLSINLQEDLTKFFLQHKTCEPTIKTVQRVYSYQLQYFLVKESPWDNEKYKHSFMWLLSMGKRSWKSERDLLTLKLNNIRQKTLVALTLGTFKFTFYEIEALLLKWTNVKNCILLRANQDFLSMHEEISWEMAENYGWFQEIHTLWEKILVALKRYPFPLTSIYLYSLWYLAVLKKFRKCLHWGLQNVNSNIF